MEMNKKTLPPRMLLSWRKFQALLHKRDATTPVDDHVLYPDGQHSQISKNEFSREQCSKYMKITEISKHFNFCEMISV